MRLTHVAEISGRVTLIVEGDVDLAVADELAQAGRNALVGRPTDTLYLDLSDVTFMDSSALNALITIRNSACAPVILVSPSRTVRRLLELTALDQAFVIESDDATPDEPTGG